MLESLTFDTLMGELHQVLEGYRQEAPVALTHFMGLPAWVISHKETRRTRR